MSPITQLVKTTLTLLASQFGEHNRANQTPKLWLLMYHRILPQADARYSVEEPGMVVTPEVFAMHLREAKKLFELMSLRDWLARASAGQALPAKACAITFDDGWLDNYQFALPILQRHQVPATVFAVADKIGTPFRFWPNIVSELIAAHSPALRHHPVLAPAAQQIDQPYCRERVARCIGQLKAYSDDELFAALEAIDWSSALASGGPALMDWAQLAALTHSGLVEVGSHSCSHRRLNKGLATAVLDREIATSKDHLARRLGQPID